MPAVDVGWLDNRGLTPRDTANRIIGAYFSTPMGSRFAVRSFLVIAGCSALIGLAGSSAESADTIRISGSSTVFPITKAAIQGYRTTGQGKSVDFDVKETGSTAGFREFCNGNIPLANASRPISGKELKRCAENGINFIELPIAFDAITVVVNPGNDWARSMTVNELSRLWNKSAQGTINRWNQVNLDYPDQIIQLPFGVYAVKIKVEGLDNNFFGIVNFGKRPTFDKPIAIIEAHIFDFDQDIYGKNIEVFFESKIRDEKKFSGIKELLNQITLDITIAKDKLNYGN